MERRHPWRHQWRHPWRHHSLYNEALKISTKQHARTFLFVGFFMIKAQLQQAKEDAKTAFLSKFNEVVLILSYFLC